MKKNILFLMILLASFLIITGCGKKEEKENEGDRKEVDVTYTMGEMQYIEPKGYKERIANIDNVNYQSVLYKFFDYSIQVSVRKNRNINDLKPNMTKQQVYEVNSYKFRFIEDGGGGTTFDSYYAQYHSDAYIIEFYGNKTEANFKYIEDLLTSIQFIDNQN